MTTVQTNQFQPTSITGCSLWLDAADNSTLTLTAGSVTQWNDKSGNTRNTSAVYGTPILRTDGFGGRQAVYFGANTAFTGPITNTGTTVTGFIVGRINTIANPLRLLSLGQAGRYDFGNTTDIVICTTGNATTELGWYRNFGGPGIGGANVTPIYNAGFQYNVTVNGSSGVIWLNSTTTASGTTSGSFGYSTYGIGLGFTTGSPGITQYLTDGFVAEVLVYNASLTTTQRQQVEGYLAWKWGLQTSLPSNHPYRYMPPSSTGAAIIGVPLNLPSQSLALSSSPFVFGFRPTNILNCALWLDAFDTSTFTLSGSNVTQWRDKSGNGNNTTSVTGTVTASNQGVSIVVSNSFLTGSLGALDYIGSTISCFIVGSLNNTAVSVGRLLSLGKVGTQDWNNLASISFGRNGGQQALVVGRNSIVASSSIPAYATRFLTSYGQTSSAIFISVNGGSQTTSSVSGSFAMNAYRIGADLLFEDSNEQFSGVINEVIVYFSELSTTQRQQVEGYLAWKWGLQTTLPSNHPFRNSPPGLGLPISITSLPTLQYNVFRPTQISGLQLWLDGADPLATGTVPAAGTTIGTWSDKSGNGRNATGSGTPTYLSGGGISFNGTNAYYTNTSFAYNLSTRSMFIVMKVNSYLQFAGVFSFIPNPSSGNDWTTTSGLAPNTPTSSSFRVEGNSGQYTSDITATLTNVNIYNDNMNTRFGSGFLNGTQSTAITAAYTAGSSSGYTIGVRWLSGAVSLLYLLTGNIYEVLLYSGPVTTGQRQAIEGYLAWKWNLVGSLPANHPFKKFPPPPQ